MNEVILRAGYRARLLVPLVRSGNVVGALVVRRKAPGEFPANTIELLKNYVRDLSSTLGTIVNGEPIGNHFRGDDAPLRAGENEVIAGGVDSPFVFSVFIA